MKKDKIILGIETSCDDTSAAVVKNGREILSNVISSQQEIHTKYGGIVPEVASRSHIENISGIVDVAIKEAGIKPSELSGVAVTYAPGLVGSLLIGISYAKAFAYVQKLPLVGVHHLYGHICANFIEHEVTFPALALVVSGGHTSIFYMEAINKVKQIANTRDDACGEVFDKIAREMKLGYPGGPVIDRLSKKGDPEKIAFPFPKFKTGNKNDFSYSGLKTAVLESIQKKKFKDEDIAASFQKTAIDLLYRNTLRVLKDKKTDTLLISGGVAANSYLRKKLGSLRKDGYNICFPSNTLCTDNAAMIAVAGYYLSMPEDRSNLALNAVSSMVLEL